jgi:hypothetical protein
MSAQPAFAASLLALSFAIVGCGGDGAVCKYRTGAYLIHYAEQPGGTCGPIPDVSINSNLELGLDPACTGNSTISPDSCQWNLDQTCPSSRGAFTEIGVIDWSQDGNRATGTLRISYTSPSCSSVYGITYTRI